MTDYIDTHNEAAVSTFYAFRGYVNQDFNIIIIYI